MNEIKVLLMTLLLTLLMFDQVAAQKNSEQKVQDKLKNTIFTPVMDIEIDKTNNYVYCSSFQAAWNSLCNDVLKGTVETSYSINPRLVSKLNEMVPEKVTLSDEYNVSLAGRGGDGIVKKIEQEASKKFKQPYEFTHNIGSDEIVVFSKLDKSVELEYPLDESPLDPIMFPLKYPFFSADSVEVNWWGINMYVEGLGDMDKKIGQIDILYMNMPVISEYYDYGTVSAGNCWPIGHIIKIKTKNPEDELIISSIKTERTLTETFKKINSMVKKDKEYYKPLQKKILKEKFKFYVNWVWTNYLYENSKDTNEIEKFPGIREILGDQKPLEMKYIRPNRASYSEFPWEFRGGHIDDIKMLDLKTFNSIFDIDSDEYTYSEITNIIIDRLEKSEKIAGQFKNSIINAFGRIADIINWFQNRSVENFCSFIIPKLNIDLLTDYNVSPEIHLNQNIKPKYNFIQKINMKMNVSKVSEKHYQRMPHAFTCRFDSNFVIYLKKKEENQPYFMALINNAELLDRFDVSKVKYKMIRDGIRRITLPEKKWEEPLIVKEYSEIDK